MKDAQWHKETTEVNEELQRRLQPIHTEFQNAVRPFQEKMEQEIKPHNEWYAAEVERIERENAIRNGMTTA